ncbi:hypothetical protein [Pannonibacter phragmitetus]|nr:hypothetical protein [Pannonibacter phragmitetus]
MTKEKKAFLVTDHRAVPFPGAAVFFSGSCCGGKQVSAFVLGRHDTGEN